MARRLVIGIGNPDRGDDGVGAEVVRRLRGLAPADVEFHEEPGETTSLVEQLEGADSVVLVDAAMSGGEAGSIRRLDAAAGPLPSGLGAMSSHGLGLAEAIELARALDVMPEHCIVLAIEADGFEAGAVLSPAVEAAVGEAVEMILRELGPAPGNRG